MEKSKIFDIVNFVDYSDGSIVSKKIVENKMGGVTLFAFDKEQRLSEHSAPFDALVQILDGNGEVIIDKETYSLKTGDMIIMPANIPHAINAQQRFKMQLTMIKS